MNKVVRQLLTIAVICLLYGCANVVPPTGGPKDMEPATISNSVPENGSINFKGKVIILEFDELVKLDNIQQKLLTTPYISSSNIECKLIKNRLHIELDSLEENTTYSLTFPDCIKDVNQGNTKVYQFAFSTGPYLDKGSLKGSVTFPTLQKAQEAYVGIYKGSPDTNTLLKRPMYLGKAKNGSYQLQNLKEGTYTVIAWIDEIKNNQWDKGREKVSFNYPVEVDTNTTCDHILYPMDEKKPTYSYSQKLNKTHILQFSENIKDFIPNKDIPYLVQKEKVYLFSSTYQEIPIQYTVRDSSNNEYTDTITTRFIESKQRIDFSCMVKNNTVFPHDTIVISCNKPIKEINQNLAESTTEVKAFKKDTYTAAILTETFKDTFNLQLNKGFLISIHDDSSEVVKTIIKKAEEENYGSIEYQVINKDSTFILQLINSKREIIHTNINKKSVYIPRLSPDTYTFIYIEDKNNNQQWDKGDIINNIQPERIIFLDKKIILKANWEIKAQKIEISEQK
ncbi:MAG: Ig-like domain-containing domain [Cytophagaceae bacterium]|jgi:hypothetical protein|nr:Ig-like domain-containing domain [Cytophagaceae bacterium]